MSSTKAFSPASMVASARFLLIPRSQRLTSYVGMYELALATVVTVLGGAASCLDLERVQAVAELVGVLEASRPKPRDDACGDVTVGEVAGAIAESRDEQREGFAR